MTRPSTFLAALFAAGTLAALPALAQGTPPASAPMTPAPAASADTHAGTAAHKAKKTASAKKTKHKQGAKQPMTAPSDSGSTKTDAGK